MKTLKSVIAIAAVSLTAILSASAQTVLTRLDGGSVDVEAQQGKVVVLSIGSSWLPLSAKQAEVTNSLAKKYASRGVVFYFVMTDSMNPKSKNYGSNDEIKAFITANKLTAAVLRDSDGLLVRKNLKVDQVPAFLILDKAGNAATEPFGGLDPSYDIVKPISQAIDKVL